MIYNTFPYFTESYLQGTGNRIIRTSTSNLNSSTNPKEAAAPASDKSGTGILSGASPIIDHFENMIQTIMYCNEFDQLNILFGNVVTTAASNSTATTPSGAVGGETALKISENNLKSLLIIIFFLLSYADEIMKSWIPLNENIWFITWIAKVCFSPSYFFTFLKSLLFSNRSSTQCPSGSCLAWHNIQCGVCSQRQLSQAVHQRPQILPRITYIQLISGRFLRMSPIPSFTSGSLISGLSHTSR